MPTGPRPTLRDGLAIDAPADLVDDPARGLVFTGLYRLPPDAGCGDAFLVPLSSGALACSLGPTPAPGGVDARSSRDIPDFVGDLAFALGENAGPPRTCRGSGAEGDRFQAVYARASDRPDRYGEIAPFIAGWALEINDAVPLRWVGDNGCRPTVLDVVLPPSGDDTFAETLDQLLALGLDRSDRKHVVWLDAGVYCGISETPPPDVRVFAPDTFRSASVVRLDQGCWGDADVASREVQKLLSGQPFASFLDDVDLDGLGPASAADVESEPIVPPPTPASSPTASPRPTASPLPTTSPSPTPSTPPTEPAASPTAPVSGDPVGATPGPTTGPTATVAPSPSPSETPVPTPTLSEPTLAVLEDRLRGRNDRTVFLFEVAAGTMSARLGATAGRGGSSTLTLDVRTPDGTAVSSVSGLAPLDLLATVDAGLVELVVSGGPNVDFVLLVEYPSP